jgi:hypothetical protein
MEKLAHWVFRAGYYPVQYQSIKYDFISWYRQAVTNPQVMGDMDVDNPTLSELAQVSATAAENLDEEHPVIEQLDFIDDRAKELVKLFDYFSVPICVFSLIVTGVAVYSFDGLILRSIAIVGGGTATLVSGGLFVCYRFMNQQIRTNAKVVRFFNEKLTEKPGDIRFHDQEWPELAARFFWNRSLCRPRMIILLVLLSVVKTISSSLYGRVNGEIRHSIDDFVEHGAKDVVESRMRDLWEGKYRENSQNLEDRPDYMSESELEQLRREGVE